MSPPEAYKLFTPLTLGKDLVLKNRIFFSPMTRARNNIATREPGEIQQIYYEERAGAGLIVTEATSISEQGHGWYGAPGIYTEAQMAAWKKVVDRVHAQGGKIFAQLWHVGREGHTTFNAQKDLVAPSAIGMEEGRLRNALGEHVPHEVPRALRTEEIPGIVEDFHNAAALAKKAGFDGVELHSANSYLIDEFLQSCTNQRTDKYGGSFENRSRFLFEIVEALQTVWPSDRIAVRLAPNSPYGGMGSADNYEQFLYTAEHLNKYNLAYLAILDGFGFGTHDKGRLVTASDFRRVYKGTIVANNSYTRDIAEGAIRTGTVDAVGFGRLYISNPDLAERFQNDWPLNADATYDDFWNADKGTEGYITFPAYAPKE